MTASPAPVRADVVVVGRGAVGVAAALALAQAGLSTVLVGAQPAADPIAHADHWDLRVFALSPATRALLEAIGAWQALDARRIAPVHDMRVFSEFASQGVALRFSAYESRLEALAWIVEQRNLMHALDCAARNAGLRIVDERFDAFETPVSPSAAPAPSVRLRLEGGRHVEARLVVGADGAASRVREAAGVAEAVSDYGQRALVAHFDTGLPHRDIAWQWFGADGILALLPLPADAGSGSHAGRVSMVWSAPNELADELLGLTPEHLAARVQAATGSALGAMTAISRVAAFPLRQAHSASMIAPRLALLGDAAHVVHPLAGQGMNLGFGDVVELVRVLREREPGRDAGDRLLLRRFERARAEPVAAMRRTTDALQKLFDPGHALVPAPLAPLVRSVVGIGWRTVAGSGWIRRRLVERAVR